MWHPLDTASRNTYLHMCCKDVAPKILDRAVDGQMWRTTPDWVAGPPAVNLSSTSPSEFGPCVSVRKAKVGFGRWAIPKLKRDLHSADLEIVHEAIGSLVDLVHDRKMLQDFINNEVIARFSDLLTSDDVLMKRQCALVVTTVCGQSIGREAVTRCLPVVEALASLLADRDAGVRHMNAVALEMLSRSAQGVEAMNDHNFMQLILKELLSEEEATMNVHLVTLEALLDGGPDIKQKAIEYGATSALRLLMSDRCDQTVTAALANLALLLENPAARRYAEEKDMMVVLAKKLNHQNLCVYTNAAMCIMNLTLSSPSKLRAVKLKMLPLLLAFAKRFRLPLLQMYCIKALTNICELPAVRTLLFNKHQAYIENIFGSPSVQKHRDILLETMRWTP